MFSLGALVLLAGCPKPSTSTAAPADAIAPRPYTADQIRGAFPVGASMVYRIEALGQPTVDKTTSVTAADDTHVTMAFAAKTLAGQPVPGDGPKVFTWTELMEHATFAAADTVRTEAEVDVPAGHFAVWHYVVHGKGDDGGADVETYDFAKELPGPPVLFTIEEGGERGFAMTLLERSSRPK